MAASPAPHSPECVAQNANTLFGEPGPCICPPPPKRRAAKAPKAPKADPPPLNPCHGATRTKVVVPTTHYGVTLPFVPSTKGLTAYATHHRHAIPKARDGMDEETGEVRVKGTFDDGAIDQLIRQHKKDPLYPRVKGHRTVQKARGSYLAKMRAGTPLVGADGRLHDAFRHTPKTLRLAMELLQVMPRPDDAEDWAADDPRHVYNEIRQCVIPSPGHELVAADFAGIEPLLVAYFMRDAEFLRACRISAHSWLASYVVGQPADFAALSDADIAAHYKTLAAGGSYTVGGDTLPWGTIRPACKAAVMTSLYAGGPGEIARRNPVVFATRTVAKRYQDILFEVCPKLPAWHWAVAETVERQGYVLAPSGFRLHYGEPFSYARNSAGQWERSLNETAKQAIAAGPQHAGAMYLYTAFLALAREYPALAEHVLLLIHDEIWGDVPVSEADTFAATLAAVMERPHPLMPLDWLHDQERANMGACLSVKAEVKRSRVSWGEMR